MPVCTCFCTRPGTTYGVKTLLIPASLPCSKIGYVCFICLIVLSRSSSMLFRKLHRYCRSDRGIANKHTAQHRAISISWHFKIASYTKFLVFTCTYVLNASAVRPINVKVKTHLCELRDTPTALLYKCITLGRYMTHGRFNRLLLCRGFCLFHVSERRRG